MLSIDSHELVENTGRCKRRRRIDRFVLFKVCSPSIQVEEPPGSPGCLMQVAIIPKNKRDSVPKELFMDEILITGGKIVLRSVQELKTVTVDDFYESLLQSAGVRTPVLPERVVFYAAKNERRLYMTHQHPAVKEIKVRGGDDEIREYSLKLPHVYFLHSYFNSAMEKLHVFCSGRVVDDGVDTLCRLPLKNIHEDGLVCIGDDLKFNIKGRLDDKITGTEDFFWESTFNSDLDTHFQSALPEVFKRGSSSAESADPLAVWDRLSMDSSFDVATVKWKTFAKLGELASKLLEE